MAVQEDYEAYERWFPQWADQIAVEKQPVKNILSCSANFRQLDLLARLYPNSSIIPTAKEHNWNLYDPCPYKNVDLIVACNVFHYLANPAKAFENIFAASRFFWMQDLQQRMRGGDWELGEGGDCMRYIYDGSRPTNFPTIYNLGVYQDRLLDYKLYDGGSKQNKRATIHFMAFFRGDVK